MDDKIKINELTEEVAKLKRETRRSNNDSWFKVMVATFAVCVIMVIYFAGKISRDIEILKENSISADKWENNETKTKFLWDFHWGINDKITRGESYVPNID